jgi:hypothetical protein
VWGIADDVPLATIFGISYRVSSVKGQLFFALPSQSLLFNKKIRFSLSSKYSSVPGSQNQAWIEAHQSWGEWKWRFVRGARIKGKVRDCTAANAGPEVWRVRRCGGASVRRPISARAFEGVGDQIVAAV